MGPAFIQLLDEYEVRYQHSWHRHITRSMMPHVWLAAIHSQAAAKRGSEPSPFWGVAELTV